MPLLNGADAGAVQSAAARLADGELLAFPTETVYGLGARADDDRAVAAIFAAKGRPADHPLIVHIADTDAASAFAEAAGDAAHRLMAHFWPGPLTLILPRRAGRAEAAAGGQETIGLRLPSHPVARALLRECARRGVAGVAGPSANRFGRISPTTAAHVTQEFGPALWVLDGGPCDVGIESAIVDCSGEQPALLRPGGLDRRRLEQVLGQPLAAPGTTSPRAPGTLAAHYAPNARLLLLDTAALGAALSAATSQQRSAGPLAVYSWVVPPASAGVVHRVMPGSASAVAHELFAVLREFDAGGASQIWVEQPPPEPEWDGVRDRLQRAAAA
jgi:L-threonylcarbamoyladenylate synthase